MVSVYTVTLWDFRVLAYTRSFSPQYFFLAIDWLLLTILGKGIPYL